MDQQAAPGRIRLNQGDHFSCSLSAALLAVIRRDGGDTAVDRLLAKSGCTHPVPYLETTGNWLSFSEAMALLDAAVELTGDPLLARRVGEQAIPTVTGSPVAAMLRALGSPEEAFRRIPATTAKMNLVSISEAVEVRDGYAELRVRPRPGFPRARQHCEWTRGLLTQPPLAFGLPPAVVEHDECAATGAEACVYRVRWHGAVPDQAADPTWEVVSLREQLKAMSDRLDGLFDTAADLISCDELDVTLARITDRAAHELRNPRCLLAIRPFADDTLQVHQRGLDPEVATGIAEAVLNDDIAPPSSWLVAPVRSHRRDYGRLVAVYDSEALFFPQERRLIEVFASYAATALDSATALLEAQRRHQQTDALLELARTLASAASSRDIARRLAEAVPKVVACDRVSVYVWQEATSELVRAASRNLVVPASAAAEMSFTPDQVALLRTYIERPGSEPQFVDARTGDRDIARFLTEGGAVAAVIMPIATRERFLGALVVSVVDRPERLNPTPALLDRLSGVAAHATTALENGRLVDQITHQARHDGLTGLANRTHFHDRLAAMTDDAADHTVTVFYIDLDGFKEINDRLGHAAGDDVLRQAADRLRDSVRGSDTVARLGGDEFAVLAEALAATSDADALAARLARAFDAPFRIAGDELRLTASVGRATWPADTDDLASLLQRADSSMYAVKRSRARRRDDAPEAVGAAARRQ